MLPPPELPWQEAKTLLIERNPYLGGEATHSGVAAFCGFFTCGGNPVRVVEGAGELILKEMKGSAKAPGTMLSPATGNKNVNFHPEYLKCAMDNVLEKTGVTCFFHTRITGVCTEERAVTARECVETMRGASWWRQRRLWTRPETPMWSTCGQLRRSGEMKRECAGGYASLPLKRRGHLL